MGDDLEMMTHVRTDGKYVRRRKRNDPSFPVALTWSLKGRGRG
jgi:hypothetical protein